MNIKKFGVVAILVAAIGGLGIAAVAQEEGGGGRGGRGGGAGVGDRGGRGSDGNRVFLGLNQKPDLQQALRGQPLYEANCASCHGMDARNGTQGPTLLYAHSVMSDVAGNNLIPIIRNGKGTMPGFRNLSDQQVADIAMYLNQLFEDVANRGTYAYAPREKILIGNSTAGKAYFDSNCASCHTPDSLKAKGIGNLAPQTIQQTWIAARGPAPVMQVTKSNSPPIRGSVSRKSDFEITLMVDGKAQTIPIDETTKVETVEDKMLEHDRIAERVTNTEMYNITAYLETLK